MLDHRPCFTVDHMLSQGGFLRIQTQVPYSLEVISSLTQLPLETMGYIIALVNISILLSIFWQNQD